MMLLLVCRFIIFLHFIAETSWAALPPGFDEEIYCPDRMCLRKRSSFISKHRGRMMMVGPRAMFLECFNPVSKETSRPRVWGKKLDQGYKDSLLQDKWHMGKCPEEDDYEAKATTRKGRETWGRDDVEADMIIDRYLLLGSRLDNIIETLAVLSFI